MVLNFQKLSRVIRQPKLFSNNDQRLCSKEDQVFFLEDEPEIMLSKFNFI